jgi:uncharacterized membrane protein HdeD (DUF308 family)
MTWPAHHLARGRNEEETMIILGVIVLIVGLVAKIPVLETVGLVLAVVGAVLMLLGAGGHAVAGRRHYW